MSARKTGKNQTRTPPSKYHTYDPKEDPADDMVKYGSNFLAININFFETLDMLNKLIAISKENGNELGDEIGSAGWCVINPLVTMGAVIYTAMRPIREALAKDPTINKQGIMLLKRIEIIRSSMVVGITYEELINFLMNGDLGEDATDEQSVPWALKKGIKWAKQLEKLANVILTFMDETPCISALWPAESRAEFVKYKDLLVPTMTKISGLSFDNLDKLHDQAFKPKEGEENKEFSSKVAIDRTLSVLEKLTLVDTTVIG